VNDFTFPLLSPSLASQRRPHDLIPVRVPKPDVYLPTCNTYHSMPNSQYILAIYMIHNTQCGAAHTRSQDRVLLRQPLAPPLPLPVDYHGVACVVGNLRQIERGARQVPLSVDLYPMPEGRVYGRAKELVEHLLFL